MAPKLSRLTKSEAARSGLIVLTAGAFLALTDAFGSRADLWLRLAYWIPLMFGAGIWANWCMMKVERLPGAYRRGPVRFIMQVLAVGLPLTVVVWAVTGWVYAGRGFGIGLLPGFTWRVLLITAAMIALATVFDRSPSDARPAASRFPARLPPRLRGAEVLAVQAEDHYLRIHTDRGSDLILMRLSDAEAELEGLGGARVHRSWWVARGAVTDVRRGDGRALLTLRNGIEVPVSRRYARALREAGWY